jgi:TolB-like protein
MHSHERRRLLAVMFTDVVGYTALMQGDEEAAKTVRRRHRQAVEAAVAAHDGELLQYLGDGSLPLRIGIHLGDISFDTQGAYGDSMNVAARIQALGTAGSVLVSAKAYDEIKNQPGVHATRLGDFPLKGVGDPLELFAVVAEAVTVPTAADVAEAMRRIPAPGPDPLLRLKAALAGRYDIDRKLGEGGMAVVYLAEDVRHRRPVAVKILKPELGQSVGTERFLREIDIAAKLSHPHILPLFDSGQADGLFYLVMPYVEGESLRDLLDREASLPLEQAVSVASEIADALAYAHERGLVHRDIKPENILFQAGHAAVADFGIALGTLDGIDARLTGTGMAVGTAAYMSPEQAAGDREVDGRTDIYALGCMLFEMLEGKQPFAGQTPQAVLASKLTGGPPKLNRSADLPETLPPLLERALAVDPADRPDDARQFVTELQTALSISEIEAAGLRRRRRSALRGAGVTAIAAVLAIAAWWLPGVLSGPSIQALAILPFENELTDPEQTTLLAGMHEALIGEVQQAGFEVRGRRSVREYLGDATPPAEIARQQRVDAVVEGRAEYGQDSVRITLTLIDGRTENVRLSRSYASAARDVMSLYRDATLAIAGAVGLEVSDEVAARWAALGAVDPQSYELTLRANHHWTRLTPQDLEIAQGLYEQALSIDEDNALALGGLAKVWAGRLQFGLMSPAEASPLIRDYMRRALETAPNEPSLVALNAMVLTWLEWDWEAAGREFERAIDLNPSNWEARAYYSHFLTFVNRPDEARMQAAVAREGDPYSGLILGLSWGAMANLGEYQVALEGGQEALRLDPSQPVAHDVVTMSLRGLGRTEEAVRSDAGLFGALGDTVMASALLSGLDEGGPLEASARAAAILEARGEFAYVAPTRIALAHLWAGDVERALDWIERGEEIGDPATPYAVSSPVGREAMGTHPRFQAIRDRMGLPKRGNAAGG